jgi:sulfoxide reductase catalytic subunit YedY
VFHIRRRRGWEIPEREATPEESYLDRRRFIKDVGLAGLGAYGLLSGLPRLAEALAAQAEGKSPYPAERNPAFTLDRPITTEIVAARHNNFYEFTTDKGRVWKLTDDFVTKPWQVEVAGNVAHPMTFDVDDLVRMMPLEERLYRFRCVEAWSMAVPWTGFPFKALIDRVEPTSRAKYVRFVTFNRPKQAPGFEEYSWYPWPYHEGLRMDEAMNELTLVVTGIYGHELPKQHGAPIRLITPWKYGYKSIKSIVRIEFVEEKPPTFWNSVAPKEYGFLSNVNPDVPHPRWSQATEMVIGTNERRPTLLYNGYEEYVSHLYEG